MKPGTLLAALAATVVLCGCSSSGAMSATRHTPQGSQNICDLNPGGQQGPGGAPIVCIDYQTFTTTEPSPQTVQANRSVVLQFWFYNEGTASPQLDLEFTNDTPIQNAVCNADHCVVQVMPNVAPHAHIQRKYSIVDTVTGHRHDPDILIEP